MERKSRKLKPPLGVELILFAKGNDIPLLGVGEGFAKLMANGVASQWLAKVFPCTFL